MIGSPTHTFDPLSLVYLPTSQWSIIVLFSSLHVAGEWFPYRWPQKKILHLFLFFFSWCLNLNSRDNCVPSHPLPVNKKVVQSQNENYIQNRRKKTLLSGYKKQFCFSTTRSFLKVIQGLTFGSLFLKERVLVCYPTGRKEFECRANGTRRNRGGGTTCLTYTWYTWTMRLFCLMDRKGQASLVCMFFPPLIHCCTDE